MCVLWPLTCLPSAGRQCVPSPGPAWPREPEARPLLLATADQDLTSRCCASQPPAPRLSGLLGMCTPFQIPGKLTSHCLFPRKKMQPRGGWALGWEGLTKGKASFPGTPSTSGVNPTGKGSGEEDQADTQRWRGTETRPKPHGRRAGRGWAHASTDLGPGGGHRKEWGTTRCPRPEAGRRVLVGAGPRTQGPTSLHLVDK